MRLLLVFLAHIYGQVVPVEDNSAVKYGLEEPVTTARPEISQDTTTVNTTTAATKSIESTTDLLNKLLFLPLT